MRSSLRRPVPPYIGVDLTDRHAADPRDIDVCGLESAANNRLIASFWCWQWMPSVQTLNASAIAEELRASRVAMLDGPQALAAKGTAIRVCERQSAAVGKTPDFRPDLKKPFAGFICSSIDLFAALMHEGIAISPPGFIGGANEVYPGHIWILLGGRRTLPRKTTEQGRLMRKHILEILGVCGLPSLPTHDQNDAALAALIAAAADDQVPGIRVLSIGAPLSVSPDGVLREGPMAVVLVGNPAASRIADTVRNLDLSHNSAQEPKTSASSAVFDRVRAAASQDYSFVSVAIHRPSSCALARARDSLTRPFEFE